MIIPCSPTPNSHIASMIRQLIAYPFHMNVLLGMSTLGQFEQEMTILKPKTQGLVSRNFMSESHILHFTCCEMTEKMVKKFMIL